MKRILPLLALLAAACGPQATPSTSEAQAAPARWSKILECESGSVWVDVDLDERRHLQLVVRHRDANRYLDAIMARSGLQSISGGDFERTYEGLQASGYFGTGDAIEAGRAQLFQSYSGAIPLERGYQRYGTRYDEHLVFKREGQGLKVEFTRTDVQQCYGYQGRYGTCDDRGTFAIASEYRGNWFFNDCHEL